MGKTFKHKLNSMYRLGLINDPPLFLCKFWDRHNFDKGEYLELRNKKREAIFDKEMRLNIIDDNIYKLEKLNV